MTSLLIGCGNLGEIILKGFQKSKKKIVVLEKKAKISKYILRRYENVIFLNAFNKVNWNDIEYIMICVKPADSSKILNEIKSFCCKNHLVISFVAGLRTTTISKLILSKSSVIRIMPNIFISSNNSASAVYSKDLKANLKKKITRDFKNFGKIVWVDHEKKIDFFTAMFGGGPAYFFYILDSLIFLLLIDTNSYIQCQINRQKLFHILFRLCNTLQFFDFYQF